MGVRCPYNLTEILWSRQVVDGTRHTEECSLIASSCCSYFSFFNLIKASMLHIKNVCYDVLSRSL